MPERVTIQGERITMDLLLWRRYGVRGQGLLNQAYDLNPNLADRGPILPLGKQVLLPDMPPETAGSTKAVPSLFEKR